MATLKRPQVEAAASLDELKIMLAQFMDDVVRHITALEA